MEVWGYPLDFEHPGGASPTAVGGDGQSELMPMSAYPRWVNRVTAGEELARCRELLTQISEGRVMRMLNALDRAFRHLGWRQ